MTTDSDLDDLSKVHQNLANLLRTVRRHLHANPELVFRSTRRRKHIREILQMEGVTGIQEIAGTGLYVDIKGDHPGPMVGYRADIRPRGRRPEGRSVSIDQRHLAAHLCGHDAHSSVAIVRRRFAQRLEKPHLHGTVRVFFQPNEEGVPSGAPVMIDGQAARRTQRR